MKKKFIFLLTILIIFCSPNKIRAIDSGNIVINEIAWMGNKNSANNEWIELKSNINYDIDLSGWKIKSVDGKLNISLKGFIIANGFYLMERTDDNSVPQIPADLIYTGALSNTGQYLQLYDNLNNLIDSVNFLQKWPAGDNTNKQTMEKTANSWQTSANAGGTPKAENSTGVLILENQKSQIINPNQASINDKKIPIIEKIEPIEVTYPEGIIINEIFPSPQGADDIKEWIELYNTNTVPIDISGWKIQDTQGTPTTYTFAKNTIIASNGYLVIKRLDTKIILNNDQDGLKLILPNEKIIDSVEYINAPIGQSYNRLNSEWKWSNIPTEGTKNQVTDLETKKSTTKARILPKDKKTDNTNLPDNSKINNPIFDPNLFSASLSQNGSLTSNPWLLFLIALTITVIFAVIIVIVKLKKLKF